MFEFLSYDFIVRAFMVGYLCAVITALMGNFLVAGRHAIISDMLAHTSLAGVGLGIFLGISPNITAVLVAILASVLLFLFSKQNKTPAEAFSMLLLTGGVALAVLFSHLAKNSSVSLETFLFGSILTVTPNELVFFALMSFILLGVMLVFWNRFLCMIFDPDFFQSRFKFASALELLFLIIVGMLVAISLKIIGALLIGALLVIPVVTAQIFAKSFSSSVLWSIVLNLLGVTIGILSSFYFDIPASSAVVLSLIGLFLIFSIVKTILQPK